jgi:hypothetical protein
MNEDRVAAISRQLVEAGLPTPTDIRFAQHGGSIAELRAMVLRTIRDLAGLC